MIYEYRRYECLPGKLEVLNELMEDVSFPLFRKHGMKVVGAWVPVVGDDENTLVYLLAYDDMASREKAWEAFNADPEWTEGLNRYTEKAGGPIVAKTANAFLSPTAYSPLT